MIVLTKANFENNDTVRSKIKLQRNCVEEFNRPFDVFMLTNSNCKYVEEMGHSYNRVRGIRVGQMMGTFKMFLSLCYFRAASISSHSGSECSEQLPSQY